MDDDIDQLLKNLGLHRIRELPGVRRRRDGPVEPAGVLVERHLALVDEPGAGVEERLPLRVVETHRPP